MPMTIRAGVAIEDINPRKPMALFGYPHVERVSTGIHDPILASFLCLDNGRRRLVLFEPKRGEY